MTADLSAKVKGASSWFFRLTHMNNTLFILPAAAVLAVSCDKPQTPPLTKPVPPPVVNVWQVNFPENPDEKLVQKYLAEIPEAGAALDTHGVDSSEAAIHCMGWLIKAIAGKNPTKSSHITCNIRKLVWDEQAQSRFGRVGDNRVPVLGERGKMYYLIHFGPEGLACPANLFILDPSPLLIIARWTEGA